MVSLLLTILGIALGLAAWWYPRGSSQTRPEELDLSRFGPNTEVSAPGTEEFWVTADRFTSLPTDRTAACPNRSFTSVRADALMCAADPRYFAEESGAPPGSDIGKLPMPVNDPCFPMDAHTVLCTKFSDEFIRFKVTLPTSLPAVKTSPESLFDDGVPIWPYALRLRDGTMCRRDYIVDVSSEKAITKSPFSDDEPDYVCGEGSQQGVVGHWTLDPDGAPDRLESFLRLPETTETGQATALERSDDASWSALYSKRQGTPYTRTEVAAVWF